MATNKKKKKISTSKFILWATFLICVEMIAFCQYAIIRFEDSSSIYAMIGATATFIPVVIGYFVKSKAENTVGGVTFETAMAGLSEEQDYIDGNESFDEEEFTEVS